MQYIKNDRKRFHRYVANRVIEIREVTTPDQWRHCPEPINPADDASRGLNPQKLSSQHFWWRGPEFLWEPDDRWLNAMVEEVLDNNPEVRASTNVHRIGVEQNDGDVNSTMSRRNVQPGNLVLIAEDNVVGNRWPLGHAVELFTGQGGMCAFRQNQYSWPQLFKGRIILSSG